MAKEIPRVYYFIYCVKCGSARKPKMKYSKAIKEVLHCKCKDCGYVWTKPCIDAKEKANCTCDPEGISPCDKHKRRGRE